MQQKVANLLKFKKTLAWSLWLVNLLVVFGFWLCGAQNQLTTGNFEVIIYAVARLFGLLAAFSALTQFVLMGRAGWLEPIFGLDKLAIFHRRNGMAVITLILAHASFMVASRSLLGSQNIWDALQGLTQLPGLLFAMLAALLFLTIVAASIYIVRRHLKFETWYAVHVLVYLAIVLASIHQFAIGSDINSNPALLYYWIGIYTFAAANIVIWRFGRPLWRFAYFKFKVEKTVQETPTATSVYITGKHLQKFKIKGGQFVLVRFLDSQRIWQEHPFSLSMIPDKNHLRLTIRQLGDFTNSVPKLKPGTPVIVSGPYGAFTHQQRVTDKILYIAGGIGITPIRAMIEEQAKNSPVDSILLYGNRTQADTVLWQELQKLASDIKMLLTNVLSEQPDYKGEKGYIDKEKIARLVPDVAERDVFLCGPPPMMQAVKKALKELGVPARQVHYERFSLHKQ